MLELRQPQAGEGGHSDRARVLNVLLYLRCEHAFGQVRILNAGERQISRPVGSMPGMRHIIHPGEYYVVCCPFCNDTRFRCYINHQYGVIGPNGFPQTRLVHCFNGGCGLNMGEKRAFDRMEQLLIGWDSRQLTVADLRPGREVTLGEKCSVWPGDCIPVSELPADHVAVRYLQDRRFDVRQLVEKYDVRWCQKARIEELELAAQRIVIPVYQNGAMLGWQARLPYDPPKTQKWPPKYYTAPGMSRRLLLYNLDRAVLHKSCAIVEGVTDVWRFDGPAVCSFGDRLTDQQMQLFVSKFIDSSAAIVYDADLFAADLPPERTKTREAAKVAALRLHTQLAGGCCITPPPLGYDPAEMETDALREYVRQQAAMQGVVLDWGLR